MDQKKYYVVGAGRCGSHWIESMLRVWVGDENLVHTHDQSLLKNMIESQRESSVVIVVRRKNIFQAAISHAVAEHTDEWFHYTDKFVRSFDVDPLWFKEKLYDIDVWYYHFDKEIRPLFPNVVDIWYEDLKEYPNDPALFLAEKMQMKSQSLQVAVSNKNPRDYRKLIRNWEELERVAAQYKFEYRIPGT